MKSFGKVLIDEKVSIPEKSRAEVVSKIQLFTEKLYLQDHGGYYEEKRLANANKTTNDSYVGKMGEFLAAIFLHHNYGFPQMIPDLEIRKGSEKKWLIDLPYGVKNSDYPSVHVKACTKSTLEYVGDPSWTFQYANSDGQYGRDKLFCLSEDARDMIIMMYVEDDCSCDGIVKSFLPWRIVRNYLSDPKKDKFKGIKKCLYMRDLISNQNEIEKFLKMA